MDEKPVNFAIRATDAATAIFKNVEHGLERVEGVYKRLGGIAKLVGGAFLLREAGEGIDKVIEKGKEWEAANGRIVGILRATGASAGLTKKDIEELASTLEKGSLADDDAIKGVAATLLKFGNIQEDVFKRAARASLDLAGVMNGDFAGAAQVLGQALASPELGLKGLQQQIGKLTPVQKEVIENFLRTGDLARAQAEILKIVESRVGGLASTLNTGLTKSTADASKAYDEFLKAVARSPEFQEPVRSFFDALTHGLEGAKDAVESGGWIDKLIALYSATPGASPLPAILRFFDQRGKPQDKGKTAADFDDAEIGQGGAKLQAIEAARKKKEQEKRDLLFAAAQKTAAARASASRSEAQGVLEAEKNLGEARLRVLDLENEAGIVSIQDYYARRRSIEEAAINAEVAAVDKSIAAQRALKGFLKEPEQQISAQAAIDADLRKREELQKKLGRTIEVTDLQQEKSAQALRDQFAGVNAELEELRGNLGEAARIRFETQFRIPLEQAKNNKDLDPTAAAKIVDLGKARQDVADFNVQRERQADITSRLALEEERIQNAQRVGAISSFEALQQTARARTDAAEQLRTIGDELERIAQSSGLPSLKRQSLEAKTELEKLAGSADLVAEKIGTVFKEAAGAGMDEFQSKLIETHKLFKSMLAGALSFVAGIARSINKLAQEEIGNRLWKSLKPSGGSGGGGFTGWLASLFGGGSGDVNVDGIGSGGQGAASVLDTINFWGSKYGNAFDGGSSGGISKFANGDIFTRPTLFQFRSGNSIRNGLMGEGGGDGEGVLPLKRGRDGKLGVTLNGGGGGRGPITLNLSQTFVLPHGGVGLETQNQIAVMSGQGINRALERFN